MREIIPGLLFLTLIMLPLDAAASEGGKAAAGHTVPSAARGAVPATRTRPVAGKQPVRKFDFLAKGEGGRTSGREKHLAASKRAWGQASWLGKRPKAADKVPSAVSAPELDSDAALGAVALIVCAGLLLRDRRRQSRAPR